jgi:hypothetical protein
MIWPVRIFQAMIARRMMRVWFTVGCMSALVSSIKPGQRFADLVAVDYSIGRYGQTGIVFDGDPLGGSSQEAKLAGDIIGNVALAFQDVVQVGGGNTQFFGNPFLAAGIANDFFQCFKYGIGFGHSVFLSER